MKLALILALAVGGAPSRSHPPNFERNGRRGAFFRRRAISKPVQTSSTGAFATDKDSLSTEAYERELLDEEGHREHAAAPSKFLRGSTRESRKPRPRPQTGSHERGIT